MKLPELHIDLKQFIFIVLITQTAIGVIFMVLGFTHTTIDTESADEMLIFIRDTNLEYYQQIVSETDDSYSRDFYVHYQEKGHRGLLVAGMVFLFMSINIAIVYVYFDMMDKKNAEAASKESDDEDGEEGSEENDDDDNDESF